jgi:hypothetical protein
MKISEDGIHYWIYTKMEGSFDRPSVCKFFSTVYLITPLAITLFLLCSPLFILLFLLYKCGVRFPLQFPKLVCPFGKVEAVQTGSNPGNSNRGDSASAGDDQ